MYIKSEEYLFKSCVAFLCLGQEQPTIQKDQKGAKNFFQLFIVIF